MISGILAIASVAIFQHLNFGYLELIEKCSLPWESYLIDGTNEGFRESKACRDKCKGNAFHTNEGKLICFYKRDIAQRLPTRPSGMPNKSTIEKCDCGYSLSGYKRNRMSCNFSIPDTTKQLCEGICEGVSVYLFKRQNKKKIVHCEQDTRKEFYQMDGQIGHRHLKYKSSTKYWVCACGIANYNTHFKRDERRNESSDFDIFEECTDPWKESKFYGISKVKTCEPRCHLRCQLGYGFYYKEKPFCFHHSLSLIRRTIFHGGSKGICECGHGKRNHGKNKDSKLHTEFFSCNPPIVRNDLNMRACKRYCSTRLGYIHISGSGPWNIRCMPEDDDKSLKPEPLFGKCFDAPDEENDEESYTICRCGLLKKHKNGILVNRTKVEATEIKLPDLWGIKRKRSKTCYQKSVTKDN